jgi:hypothetical protein
MHHAWQIEDIWFLISQHLEPRDLSVLAQTCRLLFDIATNDIWRAVTDLSVFLYLLPEDSTRRWLRPEDIRRLDLYATKVQNINLEGPTALAPMRTPERFKEMSGGGPKGLKKIWVTRGGSKGLKKTWEVLWQDVAAQRSNNYGFLPNLRHLRINNVAEELLAPLVGISGLRLERLHIMYMDHSTAFPNMLNMLERFQDTPKLEDLLVQDGDDGGLPLKVVQQSPLKTLQMDPRAHAAYYNSPLPKQYALRAEIFRKSTLQHLNMGLARDWYFPEVETIRPYFPALKTLTLDLIKFKPSSGPCPNGGADSWTCAKRTEHASDQDCGRRSPAVFFRGLDSPALSLLEVRFPCDTTASMFLDVVSAVNESCRLQNLTELRLTGGGGLHTSCWGCGTRTSPKISSAELRDAIMVLLPLPRLRVFQLNMVPNFLDVFDLDVYRKIANALPTLEKLKLGDADFARADALIPMHHLAAFCSMLPQLGEVRVGAIDGLGLDRKPQTEWQCAGIHTLGVGQWVRRSVTRPVPIPDPKWILITINLAAYFPNAGLTRSRICQNCDDVRCARPGLWTCPLLGNPPDSP